LLFEETVALPTGLRLQLTLTLEARLYWDKIMQPNGHTVVFTTEAVLVVETSHGLLLGS